MPVVQKHSATSYFKSLAPWDDTYEEPDVDDIVKASNERMRQFGLFERALLSAGRNIDAMRQSRNTWRVLCVVTWVSVIAWCFHG